MMRNALRCLSVPAMLAALALNGGCNLQPREYETAEAKPAAKPAAAQPAPVVNTGGRWSYRPNVGPNMIVSGLAFPTGEEATSALMIHQVMPREVRAGAPYTYEIHVTNLTGGTLQNVMVTASNFQNLAVSGSTPAPSKSDGSGTVWVVGDLGPQKTQIIRVNAQAAAVGASAACVTAAYNNSLCMSTSVTQPALVISKTQTPEVTICDPINIKLEVKNTGTGMAENVVVKDALPAGLTVDGKQSLELAAGNLASGESKVFNLVAKAGKTGKFENQATAASGAGLTASSQKVATVVRQPVLTLACKAPERVFLGRPITYEFTIKNTGDAAAAATTVSATLPAGATFQSATGGGAVQGGNAVWIVGSLAANESKTLSLTLMPSALTNYAVAATANATCAAAVTTNCTTAVQGIPALLLDGFDDPDPVQVGQTVTYTLVVTNQGSAPLTNVKLTCSMEDTMQYVSETGPTKGNVQGMNIAFAPIAKLDPKQKATYTITVKALKAGQVQFKGEAVSDQITRGLVKIETTNFYN
jgi:uncharacterized repeat protein (TIGR01451 family)